MKPQPFKSRDALQVRLVLFVMLLAAAGFILLGMFSGKAQTPSQEIEQVPPGQEKQLEDKIPKHLPIKVKVKNLNSKKWAHDLEVEVKNTSDKPIYFLCFSVHLVGVTNSAGDPLGFSLIYGRMKLINFTTPLEPEDVPIQPGDTYVFKIRESEAKGWDYLREKDGVREPKKIRIIFQTINFGDGTGYADAGGRFIDVNRPPSLNQTCAPPIDRSPASLAQHTERLVEIRSDFDPPIKIAAVKTKKGLVKTDKKFLDDDDWLKGITVSIANTSDKTITHVTIELLFHRPEGQTQLPPFVYPLTYGRSPFLPRETVPSTQPEPLLPGNSRAIVLVDTEYNSLKEYLKEAKYPASIKRLGVRVTEIGFSDGTAWTAGEMFRRAPDNPDKWIPVE